MFNQKKPCVTCEIRAKVQKKQILFTEQMYFSISKVLNADEKLGRFNQCRRIFYWGGAVGRKMLKLNYSKRENFIFRVRGPRFSFIFMQIDFL